MHYMDHKIVCLAGIFSPAGTGSLTRLQTPCFFVCNTQIPKVYAVSFSCFPPALLLLSSCIPPRWPGGEQEMTEDRQDLLIMEGDQYSGASLRGLFFFPFSTAGFFYSKGH